MYVYTYISICICTCIRIYTYIYTHIYICVYIDICIYIYTYICIYVYIYIYIYKYICIHVYIHVFIYIIYVHVYIYRSAGLCCVFVQKSWENMSNSEGGGTRMVLSRKDTHTLKIPCFQVFVKALLLCTYRGCKFILVYIHIYVYTYKYGCNLERGGTSLARKYRFFKKENM